MPTRMKKEVKKKKGRNTKQKNVKLSLYKYFEDAVYINMWGQVDLARNPQCSDYDKLALLNVNDFVL